MAETLASHHRQRLVVDLVGPVARVGWVVGRERSAWVRLVVAVDTLLGPEKTNTSRVGVGLFFRWRSLPGPERRLIGRLLVGCGGGCVFVENCTVDASIFFVIACDHRLLIFRG